MTQVSIIICVLAFVTKNIVSRKQPRLKPPPLPPPPPHRRGVSHSPNRPPQLAPTYSRISTPFLKRHFDGHRPTPTYRKHALSPPLVPGSPIPHQPTCPQMCPVVSLPSGFTAQMVNKNQVARKQPWILSPYPPYPHLLAPLPSGVSQSSKPPPSLAPPYSSSTS